MIFSFDLYYVSNGVKMLVYDSCDFEFKIVYKRKKNNLFLCRFY